MKLSIFNQSQNYTSSEKEVIKYLEAHLDSIDTLTINDLARKSLTSNATIIRLSRKINCSGFKELKVKIIKERENNRYLNENIDFSFPFSPIDDLATIKSSMTDLYLNSLKVLQERVNMKLIKRLTEMILEAKHTFMFGIGDTGITTRSFINKVNKLNLYPIFANENGEQDNIARRIKKNDLAIFTSYDSYTSEFENEIDTLSQKECQIVLITSNLNTHLKDDAALIIPVPNEEKEKKVATFFSQFAFQYVFNLLFAVLYKETIL